MQDLNLFDAGLLPEKRWVTLPTALGLALALLVLMLAGAAGFQQAMRGQMQRLQQAETELKVLALTPAVSEEAAQKEAIQAIRDRLAQAQAFDRQLASLPTSEAAPQLLEGLAHAALPDVWVTGLRWEASESQLEIAGRLLDPARLPAYLRRLEQQPVFKGQKLAQVQVATGAGADPGSASFQLRSLAAKGKSP
ncbi:PilN domain-containing protein [Inhella gelatinilytica]|uniref:PilN domain-containing protein n=1 Tax=Inhella gelatinilytica TaxID=2795030 RepID=A0A931ITP8_9BURK|nr:PilN domain-containing protein [Inhella gelatinilytica]MBH9551336.1 PilN domain-containing protein [Inhella gelatinilytica]